MVFPQHNLSFQELGNLDHHTFFSNFRVPVPMSEKNFKFFNKLFVCRKAKLGNRKKENSNDTDLTEILHGRKCIGKGLEILGA